MKIKVAQKAAKNCFISSSRLACYHPMITPDLKKCWLAVTASIAERREKNYHFEMEKVTTVGFLI